MSIKTLLSHPTCIEYCSGNGAWIASRAAVDPHTFWIAIERKPERAKKIESKIKNLNLNNLEVICEEGEIVTKNHITSHAIREVFINFPDPWPKRRHIKHRIIQPDFVQELHRILETTGVVTLVTDDAQFSDWVIKIFGAHTGFKPRYPFPYYVMEMDNYGTSYFEDLWRQKGKTIRYHQFVKI